MDKLKEDIKLLKLLNEKILSDQELSELDQDKLMDLVGEFKGKTREYINDYFKEDLNNDEKKVFINFFDNIKSIGEILTKLQNNEEPTKEEIREYFFKGKNISKVLFTDSFRNVLDYIQVNLNIKVKAEVYADFKVYFETGCYEEDIKNDPTFAKNIDKYAGDGEKLYETISQKSQERNIAVKVENNKDTGRKKVSIKANYLNKSGIAKAGFIDCVKMTPKGLVISLATSDGTISYDAEKRQLVDHLSAIYHSIINNEFKYYVKENENYILKQIKSVDDIYEVRFNMLTSAKSNLMSEKYTMLESLNINKEKFRFLSECMSQVIDTGFISDSLKRKISLEGFACSGIDNSAIANLEAFNVKELKGLMDKKEEILSIFPSNNEVIKDYFESVGKYLLSTMAIDVNDKVSYCNLITDFVESFSDILPSTQKIQLKSLYNNSSFPAINADAKEDIAKRQLEEKEKQGLFAKTIRDETENINSELLKINEHMTEDTILLRAFRSQVSKVFKKEKKVNFSSVHKLFIANNPLFALLLELKTGYVHEPISGIKYKKDGPYDNLAVLADRIVTKEEIRVDKQKIAKP